MWSKIEKLSRTVMLLENLGILRDDETVREGQEAGRRFLLLTLASRKR